MDRFGKWGLRVAITILAAFAVQGVWQAYMEASPAQIAEVKRVMWFIVKVGAISSITLCVGLLGGLIFWSSRAPRLDDRTRKEVHNATKE